MRQEQMIPGKTYRIRQWDDMEREYGLNSDGGIRVPFEFVPNMRSLCGTHVVAGASWPIHVSTTTEPGRRRWNISPEMLEEATSPREQLHAALVRAGLV